MKNDIDECIAAYKHQLQEDKIQIAYKTLVRFVMSLRTRFSQVAEFKVGTVSPGYLDYTYFSFTDDFLRSRKLRYCIVLDHRKMRFELWLVGQNDQTQIEYWELLKDTMWNEGIDEMPHYSALEVVLVEEPDFSDLKGLSTQIVKTALELTTDISAYLR